jgi:benzylsuccinate CoA-transferase BbsF subunit
MSTGFAHRPPVGLGPLYSDFAGPYLVVAALMAALHRRNRTGEGTFIDFSQVEATVNLLGHLVLEYTANGTLPARNGNRSPFYAPHGAYRCAGEDRWIAIAVETDDEWRRLCALIGAAAAGDDPRFATFEARKQNEDALDELVGSWTRGRDAWELMHGLQHAGVMAAVVEDLEDMCVRDPWLSSRHLVSVAADEGLSFRTHAQPLWIDGRQPSMRRAPRFGEHTEQVLKEVLGFDDAEIEALVVSGAVF